VVCEFTDGENDEEFEFHKSAFQKRFAGANNLSTNEGPSILSVENLSLSITVVIEPRSSREDWINGPA
jgi:hypothetical protein